MGTEDQSRSTRVCFNVTIVQTRIPVYTARRPIQYNDLHSSCSTDTMKHACKTIFFLRPSTIDQIHRSGNTGVSIASFPTPPPPVQILRRNVPLRQLRVCGVYRRKTLLPISHKKKLLFYTHEAYFVGRLFFVYSSVCVCVCVWIQDIRDNRKRLKTI